jgi:hypothetical protein
VQAIDVFHLYRGIKFFYQGRCRFERGVAVLRHPPLIAQRDRQFFYRLAQKYTDAQIRDLFTIGLFFSPTAHVSELLTPEMLRLGLTFAGHLQNEFTGFEQDLYAVAQSLITDEDRQAWLYGIEDEGAISPGCLQDLLARRLSPDIAALLLLIPQPTFEYDWLAYWHTQPDVGLGVHPWIDRLWIFDQLLREQHFGWRLVSYALAKQFWTTLNVSLKPRRAPLSPTLFGA